MKCSKCGHEIDLRSLLDKALAERRGAETAKLVLEILSEIQKELERK